MLKIELSCWLASGAKVEVTREQESQIEGFVEKLLLGSPLQSNGSNRRKGRAVLGRKLWTSEDTQTLKELLAEKQSAGGVDKTDINKLSQRFYRTPAAIWQRLDKIKKGLV